MKKAVMIMLVLMCAAAFSCATRGEIPPPAENDAPIAEEAAAFAGTVNLDPALAGFAGYIAARLQTAALPAAALTAIAVTETPSQRLGNYVADTLAALLLENSGLRVISRQDFERVIAEQQLQADLSFDDSATAKIGHNLGWRTIIFAAVEPLLESYRLSLRAVDVETGELRGAQSSLLNGGDPVLISLVNPGVTVERLSEREKILEPFSGKRNDFDLSVIANKAVYYDNEEMFITLRASIDCYFAVYHLDIDNKMQIIFPNRWEQDSNFLPADTPRVIPENTRFVIHPPYGEERILVYASERPIAVPEDLYRPSEISPAYVETAQKALRESGGSKALSVEPRGAAGQLSYTILPGK